MRTGSSIDFHIRPYQEADESRVMDLLRMTLGAGPGGTRSPEFFRWKHMENPFGPSLMLVAEHEGRIIGLRALMRWSFRAGGREMVAARPVDTATHPDAQGRGIFSRLTKEGVAALGGSTDLLFNTPNEKSLPGYLKMGWQTAGSIPISLKIRRPARFALGLSSLRRGGGDPTTPKPRVLVGTAADAVSDAGAISGLLHDTPVDDARLATPRTIDYLRWRYGSAPLLDYRAVTRHEGGELVGLAIFRVRPRGAFWESTIAEILVRQGDAATTRGLLRDAARAADVDVLTCHVPAGSAARRAVRRSGYIASPKGMTFVVHPLRRDPVPDPTRLASWALSLGDLEVF